MSPWALDYIYTTHRMSAHKLTNEFHLPLKPIGSLRRLGPRCRRLSPILRLQLIRIPKLRLRQRLWIQLVCLSRLRIRRIWRIRPRILWIRWILLRQVSAKHSKLIINNNNNKSWPPLISRSPATTWPQTGSTTSASSASGTRWLGIDGGWRADKFESKLVSV